MTEDRTPRAFLPKRLILIAMGKVLEQNDIYSMSREHFVREAIRQASCGVDPDYLADVYDELMKEAGLPPIVEFPR